MKKEQVPSLSNFTLTVKKQLYFKISVKISQLLDDAPYGYIHKGIHTHIYIKSIMIMQIYTRAHTATCMQKTYIDAWQ